MRYGKTIVVNFQFDLVNFLAEAKSSTIKKASSLLKAFVLLVRFRLYHPVHIGHTELKSDSPTGSNPPFTFNLDTGILFNFSFLIFFSSCFFMTINFVGFSLKLQKIMRNSLRLNHIYDFLIVATCELALEIKLQKLSTLDKRFHKFPELGDC